MACVSEKKLTLFVFVIILSDIVQFCQFLAETCPREFETNTVCTAHHTWIYILVLYLVKTGNDFYGIGYSTVSSATNSPINE